ncbi:hypothetical protein GCM10010112_92960 [Actinoplanes lobatus]|nr:hypothetical protein GCM10010112_92960 [Actinoplanes lobatus]
MQPNELTALSPMALPGCWDGPLFDWFLDRFAMLDWTIPAGHFAPGLPPRDMRPRTLLRFLLEDADYAQRDEIWAAVITGARRPGTAEAYRILSIGLAARGLRGSRKRVPVAHRDEAEDVDHDLVLGFLRRLETIDVGVTNLGLRLIDSGVTHAKSRQRSRLRPTASELDPAGSDVPEDDIATMFNAVLTELATAGRPLAEQDVKLLTLTGFDGLSIKDAAQRLGIGVQAAYKRHQRAHARIREHLAARDQEPATAVRDARASVAAEGSSTRRTVPIPDRPRSTRRSTPRARTATPDHDQPAAHPESGPTTRAPGHPSDRQR